MWHAVQIFGSMLIGFSVGFIIGRIHRSYIDKKKEREDEEFVKEITNTRYKQDMANDN